MRSPDPRAGALDDRREVAAGRECSEGQAVIASQGGDQQLVLVSVEFGNATSNLFVIFNQRGQIINVDISRDFV